MIDPNGVREAFRNQIAGYKRALYEAEHSMQAVRWGEAWRSDLEYGHPLVAPPPNGNKHLREALNAAWRARIGATQDLERPDNDEAKRRVELLEEVSLRLCDSIADSRRQSRTTIDPGGGTDPGRAQRVGWAGGG